MAAPAQAFGPPPYEPPREDHYVHLRGATWADYERLLAIRGEKAVPRRSEVLPAIDLAELARFVGQKPTSKAMKAYRAALRAK